MNNIHAPLDETWKANKKIISSNRSNQSSPGDKYSDNLNYNVSGKLPDIDYNKFKLSAASSHLHCIPSFKSTLSHFSSLNTTKENGSKCIGSQPGNHGNNDTNEVSVYTPYEERDLPFLNMVIFKHSVKTLIDTGASISALKYSDVPAGHKLEPIDYNLKVTAVNGTEIYVYGKYRTKIHIGSLTFTWTFLVIDCEFSILGYDFLRINNIFIQYCSHCFTVTIEINFTLSAF